MGRSYAHMRNLIRYSIIALWQGPSGIINPCPSGWRLPSKSELEDELNSWTSNDENGAFGSSLKWGLGGVRCVRTPCFTH